MGGLIERRAPELLVKESRGRTPAALDSAGVKKGPSGGFREHKKGAEGNPSFWCLMRRNDKTLC